MRRARSILAALALLAAAAAPAPAAHGAARTSTGAAAAMVVDGRNGEVMLSQAAPTRRRAIASTTKLMTALLTLERTSPDRCSPSPGYDPLPPESRIDLRRGERMRVDDLLEALLLESANDAAVDARGGDLRARARRSWRR